MGTNKLFSEKYMLSKSQYEIFMSGDNSKRDDEIGIKMMLQYFSNSFTEEQLRNSIKQYNLQEMFNLVKVYFLREYDYSAADIELSNCYKMSINSFYIDDEISSPFIHIDELFESTLLSFLLVMFKWTKELNNLEIYSECFIHILFLMNEVCIFGEM